jgi:hypothetical protein
LVIVNFTRIGGMQELLKRYNLYLNTLLFIYNTSILLLRLFVTYLSFLDVFVPLLPSVLEDVEYGMSFRLNFNDQVV